MYKVKFTSTFKKSLKLMVKRGQNVDFLFEVVDKLMREIPLEHKYFDHPLSGKLNGFRECHIKPDWLLIYYIDKNILTLTLIDTGSHSDILGM